MDSQEPRHRILQSLGVFFAGLGILLAGIALLIWVCRPAPAPAPTPFRPLVADPRPASDGEVQKYIAGHKDLEELINSSELHKSLMNLGKEPQHDPPRKDQKSQ